MTFTHHDIHHRLISYLYGELGADERAAFEAHLGSCAACGAEVSALRATRAVSRQAVRASLDEPIPAGVHGRVMEAAMRAARAPASSAAEEAAAVREAPNKQLRLGWLRARWTFPLFATVAAMGALLLTRETVFREARRPLTEPPAAAPRESAPEAPAVNQPPAQAASDPGAGLGVGTADRQPRARPEARERLSPVSPKRRASANAGQRANADQPVATAGKKEQAPLRDELLSATKSARPAANVPAAREGATDQAHLPAKRAISDDLSDDVFGSSDAPAPAAAGAPSAAGAPATVPAPRVAAAPRSSSGAVNSGSTRAGPAARARAVGEGSPAGAAAAADPTTVLAGRADTAMRAGAWPEAITLYRDLLLRFPDHPSAPLWRRQLATAQAAAAAARPADQRFSTPPPAR